MKGERPQHYGIDQVRLTKQEKFDLGDRKQVATYRWLKNRLLAETSAYTNGRTYYRPGL